MKNILIVSPQTVCSQAITMALQNPDTAIQNIDSSQCVLDACNDCKIDLIIFLSLSPYFSSMNIIEQMRSEIGRVPAVFVVASSHSATTILKLLECGVGQYLTLPLNIVRLRNKVFTLLSNS